MITPNPVIFDAPDYHPRTYPLSGEVNQARLTALEEYITAFGPRRWFSGINNDAYGFGGLGIHAHRDSRPGRPEGQAPTPDAVIVTSVHNTNSSGCLWLPAEALTEMDARVATALRERERDEPAWQPRGYRDLLWRIAPTALPPVVEWAVQYQPQPMDWPDMPVVVQRTLDLAGDHCTGYERRGDIIWFFCPARNRAKDIAYHRGRCPLRPIYAGFSRDEQIGWSGPVQPL